MKKTILLNSLLFLFIVTSFSQPFTEQTNISLTGVDNGSVAWGDYDNDGDLDILLTGSIDYYTSISKIYKNNGNNSFSEQTDISLTGVGNSSVAWGDYDNDGDLDILLTGGISKIYKNNGNNSFTEQTDISLTGVADGSVAWGDYDNDGDLDILLTGSIISKIYQNNGNNIFTEQTGISLIGVDDGSVAWGDYDNDGDLDILLTGITYSVDYVTSIIYRNNGNNSFTEQTAISLTGVAYGSVAWGDYDNDGDLDILLTGNGNYSSYPYAISKIYQNNGNNSFTEQTGISLTGVEYSSVVWGDYDNDGDLDILLTGSGISKIYQNNGNNSFTEQTGISLTGVYNGSVAWGDYDNDGDLDILLTGSGISKIYRNDGLLVNSSPTTPTNLVQTISGSKVIFTWDKATDAETPQAGLTYNLFVKKISDSIFSKSPMSDTITGYRKIIEIGTAFHTSTCEINLDCGTYIWGVQTIDNSFAGSPFATTKSFEITTPLAPTSLIATPVSAHEIQLSWNDNSQSETSYIIERSINNNGNFVPIDTLTHNSTNYADNGLIPFTYYYYRIKAMYNELPSGYSNETNTIISFFEQTDISLTGVSDGSVAWGDYDNDGDLDILITGNGISKIYQNNGNNSFTEQTAISLTGINDGSVAWGDYDNDGDLDILLTGNGISKIYQNNGNNSFTEQTAISITGVYNSSVAWGDYDNDGDLDILITGDTGYANSYTRISKIYRNNGNNSFTEQTDISLTGVNYSSVAWGDYDNDGDLDILITGVTLSSRISKIYRNNGNNSFTEQTGISLTGVYNGSVAWGDYDNDGDLDILLTGSGISKIYRNNGNNSFTEQTDISLTGISYSSVAWGDYDNDGDLDILITGDKGYYAFNTYSSKIYQNNGNNSFTEQTAISLTGVDSGSVAWGDYDNDGDLDILLTGSGISKIYRNDGLSVNTSPTTPSNLVQTISGSKVIFTWDKATDAETPQAGLTYNLFVKKISGSIFSKSPMSDTITGYRKIIDLGNVNHTTTWEINIDCGTYIWGIQTIDNSFAGSQFATTKSFEITTPLAPTSLIATPVSAHEIQLTWNDNSQGETSYIIERSKDNNGNFVPIDTLTLNSTSYADNGLIPYTYYYYRVKAMYNEQPSDHSNETNTIISFIEQTGISLTGVNYSTVAWGDYDNDGDLDILLIGSTGSTLISKIYKNNGNNSFAEQTGISLTGVYNASVVWGDYDNDGDLDILLTGNTGSYLNTYISKIYKNNGNNSFTEQTDISLTGVDNGSVAWGDYDNDGDLDILLTGSTGSANISKIYKNNGNNSFTEQTGISLTGVAESSVAWGDYDNDGDLDILLIGSAGSTSISKIYRNNGNNSFTELTGISLTGVAYGSVAWGDYDSDGDLDILLTGFTDYYTRISKIYRNNGNNSFTEQTAISLTGVDYSSVAWGDYDNDGDLDILLIGTTGTTHISKIYQNNGNNNFTEQTEISLTGVVIGSVAWGDYDNDGDLDILLTGSTNSYTPISQILRNELPTPNALPEAPTNLTNTVSGNNVTLGWSKAIDAETSQNGLSYNISIVSCQTGKLVLSPLSDTQTGLRRIASIGNTNMNASWTINDLPDGTYSWSVQSIDNSFAGSPFATPGSFTIGTPFTLKPATPEGTTILCSNPSNTDYTTSGADGALSYNWVLTPHEAGIINGNGKTATVDWSDTYTGIAKISVEGLDNCGNSQTSDSAIVTISTCTAIIEIGAENQITIYPNPSNGQVLIKFADNSIKRFEIINSLGQVTLKKQVDKNIEEIEIKHNGIYLMRFYSDKNIFTKQVIIN